MSFSSLLRLLLSVFWTRGFALELPSAIPTSYFISNFPWYMQLNRYTCAPTSLQMIFDFYGPLITQHQIADVCRTSHYQGTFNADVIRGAQFSYLSAAQGDQFPDPPLSGYPERTIGYAAFGYSSTDNVCWLTGLKNLVSQNFPVFIANHYYPDNKTGDDEGHAKVAIGYNDSIRTIYFADPWGRHERNTTDEKGITAWDYDEFCIAWNYTEHNIATNETSPPFTALFISPWIIKIAVIKVVGEVVYIHVNISYPCPPPFNATQFPVEKASANIFLPDCLKLSPDNTSTVSLGTFPAGTMKEVTWVAQAVSLPDCKNRNITVNASGLVFGSVGIVPMNPNENYPPYNYTDMIGGSASFQLE